MTYGFNPDEIALIRSLGLEPQADTTPDYGGKTYAEEAHSSAVVAAYCFCAGCLIVIGGLAYGAGKLAGKW